MQRRLMKRRLVLLSGLAAPMVRASPAWAQSQTCNGEPIAEDAVRCPDGSIPSFSFDSATGTGTGTGTGSPDADGLPRKVVPYAGTIYGVWHTNRPGLAYKTSIDVPGYFTLNVAAGVAPGDLTIDPNGAFVWNATRPLFGRWAKSADVPAVLQDPVDHKRWYVKMVDNRIEISDGRDARERKIAFTGRR